ncbi:OB-fold domain-containing protein [Nocardia sp. CA2R105]|uniref:Zn-ribbon domain-containing OB-fold protein n=1 Tax=Nocardia coffeae TaxID=2873381 RepID=UPI001CA61E1C|nr:OB-fold domain-containing protein [Nocardia coffeae]MBY8856790.1 OB-fold domain-containing protein [Nocardia coffeae]
MTRTHIRVAADPRPVPEPDDVTRFYWDAAAAGRLVLQRCCSCRRMQYPPEICCVHCQGEHFDLTEIAGCGVIYSYCVMDRPLHAGFVDALPYVVVLVELEDQPGLRILADLVAVPEGTPLSCGLPVEVVFEQRGAVTLPQFRLIGGVA